MDIYGASWFISPYGYGSIPINTIFWGMNIHLPTIQGYKVLTHCHIWILKAKKCLGSSQVCGHLSRDDLSIKSLREPRLGGAKNAGVLGKSSNWEEFEETMFDDYDIPSYI
jgi:hypothetical protein